MGCRVEDWLRSTGLGEWIAAFRDQRITLDQVTELTDQDLREIGMTIGDRKRFRTAVKALAPNDLSNANIAFAPPGNLAPVLETTQAERRPLTMMFVDLVDSSSLGERLEAEDLLEVIRSYREFANAAIIRVGGHIARLVGDGILAYFCYPVATENDPERAVRAAVEITRGIGSLETPAERPLSVRIGIATGRVIVSDLFAGGQHDVRSITGSTPNLAARLQGFAPPNGIIVAEETYARVGRVFVCEELGAREIKGFAKPLNSWRVISEAPGFGRGSEPLNARRLTPFYGRHAELGVLAERWNRAVAGEPGTVLVVGEAGIGKSRLVEHFVAANVNDAARVVRLFASPFDEDSALHPVIAFLRATAGLEIDDPREAQIAKLEQILAGDDSVRRAALPVLAEFIGLSPNDPVLHAMSPAQFRERILSILVEQLLLLAAQKPLCLIVEDLHWLDPTTHELLGRLVESFAGHTVLMLLTARDGFEAPWTSRRTTTFLKLVPLSPGDVADMVQSLFTSREIPEYFSRTIARRTDGNPLFVEEVARGMLLRDSQDDLAGGTDAEPDLSIPDSLRESLIARLDKSGVAKRIAQIAAVIGRSMRRDVLIDVAGLPEAALEQPLATLGDAGILLRELSEGVERFTFRHALLRDAAYDSLLRDDRRDLHLRVARALATQDTETVSRQPELLAMHLTEAQELEEAAPHWLEAARRSLGRSALTEATRLLRRGLDALEKLPATTSVLDHRLALSALLGPALIALKGPASLEAQDLYGRAYALAEHVPEHPSHFPLYWGWWRVSRDFGVKKQRAGTLLARAVSRDDPELLLQAHHCNWATHFDAGDFARCSGHIEVGLGIYRAGNFRHHARLYGNHDALVCGLGALAQVEWMQGRPLNGLAQEHEARRWAGELGHIGTQVHALDVQILHRAQRRDHQEVFDLAGELVTLTSEHGLADHRAKGLIFRGWTVAMRDDPVRGLQTLEEGLARQREIGTLEDFPIYVCLHAEALARAGRPEQAVEVLQRERRVFDELNLRIWVPEVVRLLAEIMLQADPASVAPSQELLREAADLAETQGVVRLGLRIAVTTARLEMRLGETEQATRRVAAALALIAEDDGSPELADARALVTSGRSGLGSARCRTTRS
jgi:class 3 adenylate cyclase/predicted ATPase